MKEYRPGFAGIVIVHEPEISEWLDFPAPSAPEGTKYTLVYGPYCKWHLYAVPKNDGHDIYIGFWEDQHQIGHVADHLYLAIRFGRDGYYYRTINLTFNRKKGN